MVFFTSRHYSLYDFTVNSYAAVCYHTITRKVEKVELPEGDLVGLPVVLDQGRYLAALIQMFHEDKKSGVRIGEIKLCVYSFEGSWHGVKQMALTELWSGVDPHDAFLNIRVLNGDNLLVIYMKGVGTLSYTPSGEFDYSAPVPKAALMFNIRQNTLIRRLENFMDVESNVSKLHPSRNLSVVMDDRFCFYDVILNEFMHRLQLPQGVATSSVTLLMDGRYLAVISENRREILIFRCRDGVQKSRLFVHSQAQQVRVGSDDRTLVVGCSDGRVIVFTVIYEHQDPVGELIGRLPSRLNASSPAVSTQTTTANGQPQNNSTLSSDIKHINITRAQLEQLSVTKKEEHEEARRRPPSFKAVSTGVMLVQQQQKRSTSRACVIQ